MIFWFFTWSLKAAAAAAKIPLNFESLQAKSNKDKINQRVRVPSSGNRVLIWFHFKEHSFAFSYEKKQNLHSLSICLLVIIPRKHSTLKGNLKRACSSYGLDQIAVSGGHLVTLNIEAALMSLSESMLNSYNLQDRPKASQPVQRTALTIRDLDHYNIDIVFLSETRMMERRQII